MHELIHEIGGLEGRFEVYTSLTYCMLTLLPYTDYGAQGWGFRVDNVQQFKDGFYIEASD